MRLTLQNPFPSSPGGKINSCCSARKPRTLKPPNLSLRSKIMARYKEGLVLLLDISPSMHGVLPEIEKACKMLVQKKFIFGKMDEVGIVVFGAEGTENELEREVGGYEHVVVLRDIKAVDGDAVETLENLPRGTFSGDFLDAIVVGMDMLIKKYGPTNKGKQRLFLITDAQYPIKEPFEGTKEDQVAAICQQMNAHGMRLDCVVFRGKSVGAAEQAIADENDHLLNHFSKNTKAKTVHVYNPTSLYGAVRTRNIAPVTVYRGDFELSSTMKIKVWVYKKTGQEKFPSLKMYSDKAPPSDKYATHEVKVDYEYKTMDDAEQVIPPEQRIKGYRYGPQVVPISSAAWEAVKFKPEKSVKLLGFTSASNVMRHQYMRDVYIFFPEPGNSKATVAVSAIARAMKEMKKVAILRCVWRQGQGNVVIGVLTPNISSVDNIPDSFYFNVLPFAEDVREFLFPSFSSFPSSLKPSEQQQEAADNLVSMLDLAPSDGEEMLLPDHTPNPVLERFYGFLDLKAKQPDVGLPPLDKSLESLTKPDPKLLSQHKSVIENIHKHFELKENPKKKKSSRNSGKGVFSLLEPVIEADGAVNPSTELITDSSTINVEKISKLNPVQDFEALMSRRDSSKWVTKAIKEMKSFIVDLLQNSYKGGDYPKAIECLLTLRRGCICEQEPKEFNRYLQDLYDQFKGTDVADFFELLPPKNITLISKIEAPDSDVTEVEARHFPVKREGASE